MCHTPSRIPAIRTCTFAQSPRNGDGGVYAAERQESERTSRPARAGEDSVCRALIRGMVEEDGHCIPDQYVVQPLRLHHRQRPRSLASCKVRPAYHADDRHTVPAKDGSLEVGALDTETCRDPDGRRESRVDRWDWRRQWRDLWEPRC